jgi:antitoxin CcdA
MPAPAKRKVSVTLDADLVEAIEAGDEGLSARINAALRDDADKRRRQQALGRLLDGLADERGPLDTPEDKAVIARFMRVMGGEPDPDLLPYENLPAREAG